MDSLEGHFLVASPQLIDPNFLRAVVLLVQHTEQGALGVVVNRPTGKLLKDLWREVGEASCRSEQPVFIGGPVPGPIMAVHTSRSLAELEIVPGVFFAAKKASLDRLVMQEKHRYKVLVGHSGWGPGQLEGELAAGAWLTMPAEADYVFCDGSEVWSEVSRAIGRSMLQQMLNLKGLPEDPSVN